MNSSLESNGYGMHTHISINISINININININCSARPRWCHACSGTGSQSCWGLAAGTERGQPPGSDSAQRAAKMTGLSLHLDTLE
eukprot:2985976-Lingulodinium_polyedra.AAC.1